MGQGGTAKRRCPRKAGRQGPTRGAAWAQAWVALRGHTAKPAPAAGSPPRPAEAAGEQGLPEAAVSRAPKPGGPPPAAPAELTPALDRRGRRRRSPGPHRFPFPAPLPSSAPAPPVSALGSRAQCPPPRASFLACHPACFLLGAPPVCFAPVLPAPREPGPRRSPRHGVAGPPRRPGSAESARPLPLAPARAGATARGALPLSGGQRQAPPSLRRSS